MTQNQTQTREAGLLEGTSICWGVRILAEWERRNKRSYHTINGAHVDADVIRDPFDALLRKYRRLTYSLVLVSLCAGVAFLSALSVPMMVSLALIVLFAWIWTRSMGAWLGLGRIEKDNLEGFSKLFDIDTHYALTSRGRMDPGQPLFRRDIALALFSPQVVAATNGDRLERLATKNKRSPVQNSTSTHNPERRM